MSLLCDTIDLSHITSEDFKTIVYEPSDDSFLLVDGISNFFFISFFKIFTF